jgi:hypothetical protein
MYYTHNYVVDLKKSEFDLSVVFCRRDFLYKMSLLCIILTKLNIPSQVNAPVTRPSVWRVSIDTLKPIHFTSIAVWNAQSLFEVLNYHPIELGDGSKDNDYIEIFVLLYHASIQFKKVSIPVLMQFYIYSQAQLTHMRVLMYVCISMLLPF